jgi:DNA invertase Pin-like site-specific DNA recombinase
MVASAESQRTVRLLMALWDGALTKGKLIEKVKKSGEVAKDYHPIVDQLLQDGATALSGEIICKLMLLQVSKDLSKAVISKLPGRVTMQCNPIF